MNKIEIWKKKINEYYSRITKKQLKTDLETAGFTIKEKEPNNK